MIINSSPLFPSDIYFTKDLENSFLFSFSDNFTSSQAIKSDHHMEYVEGISVNSLAQPWMLFILLLSLMVIAYVKVSYPKRFKLLAKTVIQWKVAKQIIRFEKVYTHPVNLVLNLIFLLSVPLFFSLSYALSYESYANIFRLYLTVLLPLTIYIFSKLFLYKFSQWLLSESEVIEDYVFQANLFNKCLGICYLILSCLLLYSNIPPQLIIRIGIALLFFLFIVQVIRGVIIGRSYSRNLFMIILYLCTLEILPWLILIKMVKNSL